MLFRLSEAERINLERFVSEAIGTITFLRLSVSEADSLASAAVSAIVEYQQKIAMARKRGTKRGRRSLEQADPVRYQAVREALLAGTPVHRVHKQTGAGAGTVLKLYRTLRDEGLIKRGVEDGECV